MGSRMASSASAGDSSCYVSKQSYQPCHRSRVTSVLSGGHVIVRTPNRRRHPCKKKDHEIMTFLKFENIGDQLQDMYISNCVIEML